MELDFLSVIDANKDALIGLSDYLWENPETAFAEFTATQLLCDTLRKEGFFVKEKLANIPTAFSGTFGSGKPVIGFLGEYDALANLDQAAGATSQQGVSGKDGHGCGHHLLGIGALGAAIAAKRYLEQSGKSGTVIYFGCPGEEGGSGKTFMARDGVFNSLDAALTWHPDTSNKIYTHVSLANCQILYKFDGIAAHASTGPHKGRSALDAVELMNIGTNFLREHMSANSRIHYAITDAGGFSPNVVQPHAEVLYLIRSQNAEELEKLTQRVDDVAAGAALMTGTKMTRDFIKACSNTVPNHNLQQILFEKMTEIGTPEITPEDIDFGSRLGREGMSNLTNVNPEDPIYTDIKPYAGQQTQSMGSTDVGDVSWVCPTAQILVTCFVKGTPAHSWQMVTQGKQPLAHKGMLFAAKVLAATAAAVFDDPAKLDLIKAEHQERTGGKYICPIPVGIHPRAPRDL